MASDICDFFVVNPRCRLKAYLVVLSPRWGLLYERIVKRFYKMADSRLRQCPAFATVPFSRKHAQSVTLRGAEGLVKRRTANSIELL